MLEIDNCLNYDTQDQCRFQSLTHIIFIIIDIIMELISCGNEFWSKYDEMMAIMKAAIDYKRKGN